MRAGLRRALASLGLLLIVSPPVAAQRLRTESYRDQNVVSQEIIVRFRGSSPAEAQRQSTLVRDSDIMTSTPIGRTGAVRLRSRGRNVAALLQAYARRTDVEYAEPNFVWRSEGIPNDVFFSEQWALRNTGQVIGSQAGTPGSDIKAELAWEISEGSSGIVVAMLDSGIEYNHPDLATNVWSAPSAFTVTIGGQTIQCASGTHGFNAIARNCNPADDDGHGTHTAGIVGASGNNGIGVSGVSRVANIMALKFLDSTGQGTTADAIAAIDFAVQVKNLFPTAANVRILNASWGGNAFSQALLDEINLAGTNNMLLLA